MLHKIINMHRIKFDVLNEILTPLQHHRMVNIHIDLHSILADLYRADNYEESNWLDTNNTVAISSCIINLVAHYRLFFHKHYRASVRVFFYFADEIPRNNAEYLPDYGSLFFDKYRKDNEKFKPVNHEVFGNLKLCKAIMPYIPGAYYIDCQNIEPIVAATHFMMKYNEPNVVITKDPYWFQCVNVLSPTVILRLKRDDSYLVTVRNLYQVLFPKGTAYEVKYILPDMLSIVFSFSGISSRDIKGVPGYGYVKICKMLDMAIDRHRITPGYTHIKNILDEIYSGPDQETLINTFKAIDLRFQMNELTSAQKEKLNSCIVYRYNRKDLLGLNQKYYTGENSLMLQELFINVGKFDTLSW